MKMDRGKNDNLVIVTERMYDLQELQKYIKEKLNVDVRTTVLGFIQRGGNPSAFDRVLASKMGITAVNLLLNGHSGEAVGIRKNKIISIKFEDIDTVIVDKKYDYSLLDIFI